MSSNQEKDPQETLDYFVDWARDGWLGADIIVTSTWNVPVGLVNEDQTLASGRATIWLSGGTLGETYQVTNHITTQQGRIAERSLYIFLIDR